MKVMCINSGRGKKGGHYEYNNRSGRKFSQFTTLEMAWWFKVAFK